MVRLTNVYLLINGLIIGATLAYITRYWDVYQYHKLRISFLIISIINLGIIYAIWRAK